MQVLFQMMLPLRQDLHQNHVQHALQCLVCPDLKHYSEVKQYIYDFEDFLHSCQDLTPLLHEGLQILSLVKHYPGIIDPLHWSPFRPPRIREGMDNPLPCSLADMDGPPRNRDMV